MLLILMREYIMINNQLFTYYIPLVFSGKETEREPCHGRHGDSPEEVFERKEAFIFVYGP